MSVLDYIVIFAYFLGLIGVSFYMSRRIKNSEDMFIAGRNSSWWLSGVSSYMTIFSASTFVVWGGVAYKSGLVAAVVALCLGVSSVIVGKWISGRWRSLRIKSPGEYLTVRFGHSMVSFYTIAGIVGRAVHTAVALYAVAVVMCALIPISIWWALLILGLITIVYTMAGGFLAVLMTDVIQFGVLLSVVVFMLPLSFHAVGGVDSFVAKASEIPGFFSGTSPSYTWFWLILWTILHVGLIGGDWPFVQRYISVPTVKDAKKSTYLIGILYFLTPLIWYLPTMIYRTMEPGLALDVDAQTMTVNGEHAYVNMCKMVLMPGMLGMMLAAMLSATLSNVSGTLNVYANVFTYEIWGHIGHNSEAGEARRIRVGRVFTLVFGLVILGIAMLIPFAGGGEKVVVTILTMVLCPLYIPSIWGLFSKRLTGRQLVIAMAISWVVGFSLRYGLTALVPAAASKASLIESISGGLFPILMLAFFEIRSAIKGRSSEGYVAMEAYKDPQAEVEPGAEMKKAVRSFSHLAVTCFCITIAVIAFLLIGQLIAGDPKALAAKGIVVLFVSAILLICMSYLAYRIISVYLSKSKH